jgi:hypothetical protein
MVKSRSIQSIFLVFSAILCLIFIIRCGNSKEMQKMSDFLMEYSTAVDQYSDDIGKGAKRNGAEVEQKIKSFMSKWTEMEMAFGNELTHQEQNKLDNLKKFEQDLTDQLLIKHFRYEGFINATQIARLSILQP